MSYTYYTNLTRSNGFTFIALATKSNTDLREAMFRDVVERYTPLIAKVCYMYARSLDDFNDLQQEVLANLWTSIDGFANR